MFKRLSITLLICAVLVQTCWAFGELMHVHNSAEMDMSGAVVIVESQPDHIDAAEHDPHEDTDVTDHHHHHSCTAHSLAGLPWTGNQVTPAVDSYGDYYQLNRTSDAPPYGLDRPSWHSPV